VAVGRPRNRWVGTPPRKRALVPVSRPSGLLSSSAGLATSLLHFMDGRVTHRPPNLKESRGRTDVLPARRPVRRTAAMNARVRSRRTSHRRQAIRSPVVLPKKKRKRPTDSATTPLRLCAFAFLWVGGWPLCLRVFVVVTDSDKPSVSPLCLCDSVVFLGGWLCGFSVNDYHLLWTFQAHFGYC
jgi:hypothetical protein